ncbi:DUF1573 domain-containing protein [Candidatus Parcubacteria bacterium]|nr:MAG: DUF1573 domain-containing protein [Candidatus Parcubacteria bacterium]
MKILIPVSSTKLFWQIATIIGLVIVFSSPINAALQNLGIKQEVKIPAVIEKAKANEIYPMFTCPCCGEPLNKEEPCCGSMTQMIDFIDQKIYTGASKDEVIFATAQEFGIERLANESDRDNLRAKLLANAPKNAPKISIPELKKDLGIVSIAKGTVSTEFTIKNEGKSNLTVNKLSSSCGCTSASLTYKNIEGPRFYMAGHGFPENDPNWKAEIAPGDTAKIKIYYDPTVHTDLIGPVTRTISIHSNDPVEFETKLTITLDQQN